MFKYYVTSYNDNSGDEFYLLKTNDLEEAQRLAQDEAYYIERDKRKGSHVEIRTHLHDIEADDCECFDYNLVEF